MIGGAIGSLTFAAPWMLIGLVTLPAIWWLLRVTPPRAEIVAFPPARLLLTLAVKDKTPVRSPWWIAALRILVAGAVILALAGPVFKPAATRGAASAKSLFAVVDSGWAAASRWELRRSMGEQIAASAEDAGQTLYFAATAPAPAEIAPLTPASFRQRFAALEPQAYDGSRSLLAKRIGEAFAGRAGGVHIIWLSDGIESPGSDELRHALEGIAGGDAIEVLTDSAASGPLGLYASLKDGGAIDARVMSSDGQRRTGAASALTARGDRLAVLPFEIAAGATSVSVPFELPLELRNQVARLEVAGEASAGAVFLLDSGSKRRRVGIVATDEAEDSQPLLSPAHYLDKALAPFSDAVQARAANMDRATEELLARNPSVIVLSDVGRVSGEALNRLTAFVDKGGMLVRFAGPRLEGGGDRLLPAPLRKGGRTLGGAMTWASPQTPAAFEQDSPFFGYLCPPT